MPCNPIGDKELGGITQIGTTSWGEDGINKNQSFNSYPWSAADTAQMGAGATFYNISWYDMIDHYDQGIILSVTADSDYKKEMLKLIDNRNPDALLYQDFTDFYASHQYNKLFRYEEKDFVYGTQTDMAGKALSSLVPWFYYGSPGAGAMEGVGQMKHKLATFGELAGEHFKGRPAFRNGESSMSSGGEGGMSPTTILKTISMPLADTDYITKSTAGSFGGSLASLSAADGKPLGLCSNCNGTAYWIGDSAATSAVNFYIDNMIDLSPQAEALGGVETLSWGEPDMTPGDPDPVAVPD